jgi:transcriptional regulator with XRE-family HTH domain
MATKLSIKIRAARLAAGFTQDKVAKELGITRGAITQWEAKDPDKSTTPGMDSLRKFAEVCGVPFTWLIDDQFMASDAYHARNLFQAGRWHEVGEVKLYPDEKEEIPINEEVAYIEPLKTVTLINSENFAGMPQHRLAQSFWRAVEYELCNQHEQYVQYFNARMRLGPVSVECDFMTADTMAYFESMPNGGAPRTSVLPWLRRKLGDILLTERAAARPMRKCLMVWLSSTDDPRPENQELAEVSGVELLYFQDPEPAAAFLATLIKH